MLGITPDFATCNIYNSNFTTQKICNKNLFYPKDTISFSGILVRPVQNKKEISELAKLFFDSYNKNMPYSNICALILDKLATKIACLPFWYKLNKPDCYVEAVFNNNKMAGGYSFRIEQKESTGHIEFITLADKYKHTKFGISALKEMTGRICQKADKNNVKDITWVVNIANIPARQLFSRFSAEKISDMDIEGNIKYKIPFDNFRKEFSELVKNKSLNY